MEKIADGTNDIFVQIKGLSSYTYKIGSEYLDITIIEGDTRIQIPSDYYSTNGIFVLSIYSGSILKYTINFTVTEITNDCDIVLNGQGSDYIIKGITKEIFINEDTIKTLIADMILKKDKQKYPVGFILMNTQNINPSTYLGFGTWEAWGSGKVPVGVDTSDTNFASVEKTGGVKSINLSHSHTVNSHYHTTSDHTLTVDEIPAHKHRQVIYYDGQTAGSTNGAYNPQAVWSYPAKEGTGQFTETTGGGGSHSHGNTGSASPSTNSKLSTAQSILQPYITCYMWKRTA